MSSSGYRPPNASPAAEVFAAGFLIVRQGASSPELLLMRHANRWDLPKGHLELGETFEAGARRELEEETGIGASEFWQDPQFEFRIEYSVKEARSGEAILNKEVRIFLGWLLDPQQSIRPSEHLGFEWFAWSPTLKIQPQTIDPLLAQLSAHWQPGPRFPPESHS